MHVLRLIALGAVVALGQGATQSLPQQLPPRFRVETNLVRVDAYATKDGVPVLDMTAADMSSTGTPSLVAYASTRTRLVSTRKRGGSCCGNDWVAPCPRATTAPRAIRRR